ncbi:MAG: glycoside hydrolase family 127 protein [Lentisphaeria bacterium]|nr:glycoside hydrolase family 127 protein [Lentisphaeria bacterium]
MTPHPITDTSASPFARLRTLDLDARRWRGGFWDDRFGLIATVTVRRLWERLADPEAGHVLANFRIAAGREQGQPQGTWWQDAWLYKWIEAAACIHRLTGDEWLWGRMEEGIELIEAAQAPDGYIWTHIAGAGRNRFEYIRHHEVYVMGHLLTAAVVHRRMTGREHFLTLARRVGDFLCITLGRRVPECFAHNPSAIMGLVELHRETGNREYLACARRIVDARGSTPAPRGKDLWHRPPGIEGTDQIQDRVPLRRAREVVGHNVFFTYLFAGAADVFLEEGDASLLASLERMWADLTRNKMSINGGVSPMGIGLSIHQDIVVEAVGPAHFLPHADAYNETCGQVGALLWAWRMLCAQPRAEYADLMEHEMLNGILPGMGLEGTSFWYRNPLARPSPGRAGSGLNDLPAREEPGRNRICCPTNVLRTVAQWSGYACSADDDGIWVHQYGAGSIEIRLPDGREIALREETDYPWDSRIRWTVDRAPESPLNLRLRIPAWAEGAWLRAADSPAPEHPTPGTYAVVTRAWHAGETLELDLPMPVRLIEAHPDVESCRNQVAVMRGPVLYCLESADLPDGVDLRGVCVPSDAVFRPGAAADLGRGVVALDGRLLCRPVGDWQERLYGRLGPPPTQPVTVRLIPYFAWANRGPSAMSVWLPVAWLSGPSAVPGRSVGAGSVTP